MTAPIASGGSDVAGWGLHPLESAAFARRTPIPGVPVLDPDTSREMEHDAAPP